MLRIIYKKCGVLFVAVGKKDVRECCIFCQKNGLPYVVDRVENREKVLDDYAKTFENSHVRF